MTTINVTDDRDHVCSFWVIVYASSEGDVVKFLGGKPGDWKLVEEEDLVNVTKFSRHDMVKDLDPFPDVSVKHRKVIVEIKLTDPKEIPVML